MPWDCRMQSPTKLRGGGSPTSPLVITLVTLEIVSRKKSPPKEGDPLPPVKVGDCFGKNLSKKDVMEEVFFCFDPFCIPLVGLS